MKFLKISLLVLISVILVGCSNISKKETKDVSLSEILASIKQNLGDDYIPSREMDSEEIEIWTKLTQDDYEEYLAEGPMMSTHVDIIMMFKTKDVNLVKSKLEVYRDDLINNSMQYPINIAKVNSARIVNYDNYVFFLMLGAIDDNPDEISGLQFAENEIDKVEDIIKEFFN